MDKIAWWYKDVPINKKRDVWEQWESLHLHLSKDDRIYINRQWLAGDVALMIDGDMDKWLR